MSRAHKSMTRILDHVSSEDMAALTRVKRLVEHAIDNARGSRSR